MLPVEAGAWIFVDATNPTPGLLFFQQLQFTLVFRFGYLALLSFRVQAGQIILVLRSASGCHHAAGDEACQTQSYQFRSCV